jgi:hypothetical protein
MMMMMMIKRTYYHYFLETGFTFPPKSCLRQDSLLQYMIQKGAHFQGTDDPSRNAALSG